MSINVDAANSYIDAITLFLTTQCHGQEYLHYLNAFREPFSAEQTQNRVNEYNTSNVILTEKNELNEKKANRIAIKKSSHQYIWDAEYFAQFVVHATKKNGHKESQSTCDVRWHVWWILKLILFADGSVDSIWIYICEHEAF